MKPQLCMYCKRLPAIRKGTMNLRSADVSLCLHTPTDHSIVFQTGNQTENGKFSMSSRKAHSDSSRALRCQWKGFFGRTHSLPWCGRDVREPQLWIYQRNFKDRFVMVCGPPVIPTIPSRFDGESSYSLALWLSYLIAAAFISKRTDIGRLCTPRIPRVVFPDIS